MKSLEINLINIIVIVLAMFNSFSSDAKCLRSLNDFQDCLEKISQYEYVDHIGNSYNVVHLRFKCPENEGYIIRFENLSETQNNGCIPSLAIFDDNVTIPETPFTPTFPDNTIKYIGENQIVDLIFVLSSNQDLNYYLNKIKMHHFPKYRPGVLPMLDYMNIQSSTIFIPLYNL